MARTFRPGRGTDARLSRYPSRAPYRRGEAELSCARLFTDGARYTVMAVRSDGEVHCSRLDEVNVSD